MCIRDSTVGVQYLAKELELDKLGGYILSYNGGCIVDCATGAVVAQEAFPPELVKPVCDEARAAGAVAMSYNAEGVITEHPEDEYVQLECFTCRVPAIPVQDLGSFIDFDVNKILLSKNPDEIARVEEHMQQKDVYKRQVLETGIRHGTVTVLAGNETYEITTYRAEGDYEDHRRPEEVTFVSSLEEDLARRDFTINAMAMGCLLYTSTTTSARSGKRLPSGVKNTAPAVAGVT